MSDGVFVLTLPPRTEYLSTARSFAAALARHYAVVGETVEDLKIAISEACADALNTGEPIRVRVEQTDSAVAFSVDAPGRTERPAEKGMAGRGAPARIDLIRSLFPNATMATEHGIPVIRFSLATA